MADQPEKENSNQEKTSTGQDTTIFNSEIGDDWGEAFEAEDFMFSPDEEASSEFFIGGDETAGSTEDEKDEELPAEQATPFSLADKLNLPFLVPIFTKLQPFILQTKNLYSKATLSARLAVAGNFILLAIIVAMLTATEEPLPSEATAPTVSATDAPGDTRKHTPATEKQPAIDMGTMQEGKQSTARVPLPELPDVNIQEKIRKKWSFPSFLIAATPNGDGQTPSLVSVNITLEIQLAEDEELPVEKEIIVREIIYQFFNNRPLEELQRYSLARGEVKRKLKAWVEKQWPDTPISAVILDRYQIL